MVRKRGVLHSFDLWQERDDSVNNLNFSYMHDLHSLLSHKDKKFIRYGRWFNTQRHYGIVELSEVTLTLPVDLSFVLYPSIPGPLTYLWFNAYLGYARQFTPEKIEYLPVLLSQYATILQKLKKNEIAWVQLEDPIFITDILPVYQNKIIAAYQSLLMDAPKVMLATYFGGVEENIFWMKNIPIQGLHLDLENAPEQIMFVLKNKIMTTL